MSTQALESLQHDLDITGDGPPALSPEEVSAEAVEFIRQGHLPPVLPRGLVADHSIAPNGALKLQMAIEKAWQEREQPAQQAQQALPQEPAPASEDEPASGPLGWIQQARILKDDDTEPLYSNQYDLTADLGMLMRAATVVIVLIMLVAFARTATAQEAVSEPGQITVSGLGEVTAEPDLAVITTGVVTSAPTAREAVTANTQAMNGVLGRLKEMGIADRDLQTSDFSITPQYQHFRGQNGQPAPPPRIVAYEVRNTLRVRIRELESTGAKLAGVLLVFA